MEAELVQRAGIPFQAIPAAGVHGVGWRAIPGNLARLSQGYRASTRLLKDFRPEVLFFTGGYVSAPMILAGRLAGRARPKSVIYVPDIEPGLALKFASRFADEITVTTTDSRKYFRPNARVTTTGYPVRNDLLSWTRSQARAAFELTEDVPVLLVFGGSKGARSINLAVVNVLEQLLPEMQVLHISGSLDWETVSAAADRLPPPLAGRYRVYPYLHEKMGAALRAADLVLSRAGASTLGEFPLFGLPAVLVPYPYAWRYQQMNADFLAAHGAARILADQELPERIVPTLLELVRSPELRAQMRSQMQQLAQPEAAHHIAGVITYQAQHRGGGE
jgi:UDP-N-acetylglucosamine--N-acetylmuramyl-(pentapeptide) pyrophosphoryl-undecaprenol N-acetylglucosamine transferase